LSGDRTGQTSRQNKDGKVSHAKLPENRFRHLVLDVILVSVATGNKCICITLVFSVRFERRDIRRKLFDLLVKASHLTSKLIDVDA
jgi:hypothetical protein